ncbi:MAG TPA: hypothetical protein VFQ91_02085 [Bryobacteraceae bacterium]|nr:hypothetical protein [Bryobacteraceae bacterium]
MRALIVCSAALFGMTAWGQTPTVAAGGILNHYSYARAGMPNAGIAQGSIFDIYGTNIGPATAAQPNGFPLPSQLGNTSVKVTVNSTTVDALLYYVSQGQIVALLPSRTPAGTGTLVVTVNGAASAPAPITVVARSLGVLTLAQTGLGPAVMQLTNSAGQVDLNGVRNSAQPGQIGVFYGTGLGAVSFDESRGAPVQDLAAGVQAFVDGKPAKVLFQGRTPGLAGLDQLNVEIPAGINGCYATVWFQTGNIISNLSTISVAQGPQCPDPLPETTLPGSGVLRAAGIRLLRVTQKVVLSPTSAPIEIVSDIASAAFSETDLGKVPPSKPTPVTIIGGCIVGPLIDEPAAPDTGAVSYLNGGTSMTVTGPNGSRALTKYPTGFSAQLGMTPFAGQVPVPPPPYLSPGVYSVNNGSGSNEVPPFNATITLPTPAFAWANMDQTSVVQRAQGMEVTWTGGDSRGYVDIAGTSLLQKSATQPINSGALFSCRAPASAGRFQIPAQVLLYLPPTVVTSGVSSGVVTVAHTQTPVEIPLTGFPYADLVFGASFVKGIEFR